MPDIVARPIKPIKAIFIDGSVKTSSSPNLKSSYADLVNLTRVQADEIEQLKSELADLKGKFSNIEDKQREAINSAVETARQEERSKFEQDSQRIIEAGLESLESGLKTYEVFLEDSENLALHLLEFALEPLFSDSASIQNTLIETIVKSVEKIGSSSVLNIRLNGDDFGDPSEIFDIEPHLKAQHFSFEIDPMLERGECVFELLIGQYEISLPKHWELLKTFFKESLSSDLVLPTLQKP